MTPASNIQEAAYAALAEAKVIALERAQETLQFRPESVRKAFHRLCQLGCAANIVLPIGSCYYLVPGAKAPTERRGKWPRRP